MSRQGHVSTVKGRIRFTCCKILIIYAVTLSWVAAANGPACTPIVLPVRIAVQYVIDGDTVVLANGAKLRLIGIDTPELGHHVKPDQPWARAAKDYLNALLSEHQSELSIVYDTERRDKYRRILGHLFLQDGTNIQALLLSRGLALPLTVPPNLAFLDCYRLNAEQAIAARSGIWSQTQYQPRPVTAFTGNERGYHVVRGEVTRIGNSSSSVWLNLGSILAIRVVRSDLRYFANLDIAKLAGQVIEVRGMVYQRNRQLRLRIRHATDIRVLKVTQGTRQK